MPVSHLKLLSKKPIDVLAISSVAPASTPPPSYGESRLDDLYIQRRQALHLAGAGVSREPEGCGG
jgi:hypothetical protein